MNTQYQTGLLSLSPTLFYPCNETSGTTATDATGNGHNGTYVGGVTLNQSGPSSGNQSIGLDGSTAYILSPYTPTSSTFTVIAYSKVPNFSSYYTMMSVANWTGATGIGGFDNEYLITSGEHLFGVSYSSGITYVGSGTLTANTWYFWVATLSGTSIKVYTNSASVVNGTLGGTYQHPSAALIFGAAGSPGNVGGCAFFDGVALSAAQITALYTALTSPMSVSPTSLSFSTSTPQTATVSGGTSTYSASTNASTVATAAVVGTTATVTPGLVNGHAIITITDSTPTIPQTSTIAVYNGETVSISDSLSFAESLTQQKTLSPNLSDSLGFSDVLSAVVNTHHSVNLTDSFTFTDALTSKIKYGGGSWNFWQN